MRWFFYISDLPFLFKVLVKVAYNRINIKFLLIHKKYTKMCVVGMDFFVVLN